MTQGKGSRQRECGVDPRTLEANWKRTFRVLKRGNYHIPLPEVADNAVLEGESITSERFEGENG